MFCLFKTNYVKGRHFVATNGCFLNTSQKRKQTNLLISTDLTQFCYLYLRSYILNTVFDLLQKLNISSSNDSSLNLDSFPLLTILFCKISFSTKFNSFLYYAISVKKLIIFKENKIHSCNVKT